MELELDCEIGFDYYETQIDHKIFDEDGDEGWDEGDEERMGNFLSYHEDPNY